MAGVRTEFRLVVGLGNVGDRYAGTRHNAGFWYADALAAHFGESFRDDRRLPGAVARVQQAGRDVRLLKPGSLVNRSGGPVAAVARFHRIPPGGILVAHDDMDLPPGSVRLKCGGGHGGHNGLRSIDAALGSRDYWRLRIGIGHPGDREQVIGYVLNRPSPEDRRLILEAIDRVIDESGRLILDGDLEAAMHALHTRPGKG